MGALGQHYSLAVGRAGEIHRDERFGPKQALSIFSACWVWLGLLGVFPFF
jgi:hypothetical protein